MASREQAAAKLKELSAQISTLVRTVALSILAVTWLFLSGNSDAPGILQSVPKWQIMAIAGLCLLTIAFDLLQYIAGYKQVSRDYEKAKASKDPKTVIYSDSKVRDFTFWAKQVFAICASVWLVGIFVWTMSTSPTQKDSASARCLNIVQKIVGP